MARYQIKKIVAVCFLEAAKLTMEHLGQHRIGLSQRGIEGQKDIASLHGELRRLRGYLERCLGAFRDAIDLDLGQQDQRLLVASCRRAVEALDARLEGDSRPAEQERDWLQRKRQMLSDWAVEMATKPLFDLPLPRLGSASSPGVKALHARLQDKVFGSPVALVATAVAGGNAGTGGGAPRQDTGGIAGRLPDNSVLLPATADDAAAPGQGDVPPWGGAGAGGPGDGEAHPEVQACGSRTVPIDVRQIRDPRLRALLGLDVRAYQRAVEAHDHRLAAVLLSSILEGAVLDHALPRRAELGLAGSPDTWNVQDMVLRVLGEACTPKDRSCLHHVLAARNLLRPMAQLVSPTVVTPSSVGKLAEFVQRATREMGFQTHGPAPVADADPRPSGAVPPGTG